MLLGALAVPIAVRGAGAELYRCEAADGGLRFTNDPAACPGASPHAPEASVQRFESGPPRSRPQAQAPAAALAPDAHAAEEAAWRAKRQQAEQELAQLEQHIGSLERFATWCNRGGMVLEKDETGLNRRVPCDEVRASERAGRRRIEELRLYLAEGIHEECRRAGCLPGWLR